MHTTGWELEIGWRDRIRDFKYGARLNLSDARSKILKLRPLISSPKAPASSPTVKFSPSNFRAVSSPFAE